MKAEISDGTITEYERAVCYYTLPKVTSPLTYGLLIAYAVCVVEAVAALVYGLATGNRSWIAAGTLALGCIVIFGMIAFTVRALINDWRKRAALAAAHYAPDASGAEDIPDPFAGHLLLRHPANIGLEEFDCVTNTGSIEYHVETKRANKHWRVSAAESKPLFDVLVEHGALHVAALTGRPIRLGVFADKKKIAAVVRRNTLRAAVVDVFPVAHSVEKYTITNDCIYLSERLIGRIYILRDHVYLDIEREHVAPGIVAHFITLR